MFDLDQHADGATFTLDLDSVAPEKGFAVSITDTEVEATEQAIKDVLNDYQNLADYVNQEVFIGYWKDDKTGKAYLDLTVIADTKQQAQSLCKTFNQKAFFDFSNFETIDVR